MRWLVIVTILFTTGCATKPISSFHTYKTLHVELSKRDKNTYSLVNEDGKRISKSNGRNASLEFSLSSGINASSCLYISNHKGRNIFGERQSFRLPLVQEHRRINTSKKRLVNTLDIDGRAVSEYRRRYDSAWERLKTNRAFKGDTCHTPPQKPLPPEPKTKCKTEKECREEGGAICFSRFLGTEGCSIALKELKIPGLLSAPGCAAVAADLAGEKYDLDDAFVDFLHGVADDIADSLLQSQSGWDQFWGALVKGANYSIKLDKAQQCTNRFVTRFYGPKKNWLAEVNRIKREPAETKKKCFTIIGEVNENYEKLKTSKEKKDKTAAELEAVKVKYDRLLNEQQPVSFCRPGR